MQVACKLDRSFSWHISYVCTAFVIVALRMESLQTFQAYHCISCHQY